MDHAVGESRTGLDGKTRRLPKRKDDDINDDVTPEEIAVIRFKAAAQDILEAMQEAVQDTISFVDQMHFTKKTAAECIASVDKIIEQWCAVKSAVQRKATHD